MQARPNPIQAEATLISLPYKDKERYRTTQRREEYTSKRGLCPFLTTLQIPYTMPSEIARCATIPDCPSASFVRTASTSAQESLIDKNRRVHVARLKSVR